MFEKTSIAKVLFTTVALALSSAVFAKDVNLSLTGAEEVPAVTTTAVGVGTISIDKELGVTGSIKTTGIEGTAAHIHLAPAGKNGPPIITLTKGAGGVWTVPAGSKLTPEQHESFKVGDLYVNVHSAAHKAGEIRAQLKP